MISEEAILAVLLVGVVGTGVIQFYHSLSTVDAILFSVCSSISLVVVSIFVWERFSKSGKDNRKRLKLIREIPPSLLVESAEGVFMGEDQNLKIKVFLPDSLRMRHVHILGSTGSGKTESVILNFLRQDTNRGLGAVILDAKGDFSFLQSLRQWVPAERLRVFDLGSESSLAYDPLSAGNFLESAQRLFSSLTWSEEYYKSKAQSALQKLFQYHYATRGKNPTLEDLSDYLDSPDKYIGVTISEAYPTKLAERDFSELSGLRDQIKILSTGYLTKILSSESLTQIDLNDAKSGTVIYFRLQSLLSPQLVSTLGRLIINHLNYLAGTAHREDSAIKQANLIPIYLDEFASFASPEFADLISKARSARFALHFSHQSIGDLAEVSKGFLNQITDNSATKIILRISDPDSAEFFARSFGTKIYQKVTQRITNSEEVDSAEMSGEGSQREAHQFRASPDLFKTLPTGVGSVLMAHGFDTPHGASTVFKIKFPRLNI